uniref:Uncharacterized protein n=1 Tax=Arundo donax TaxID=35708 RepID=A0A0A9AKL0_ARUDO
MFLIIATLSIDIPLIVVFWVYFCDTTYSWTPLFMCK